MQESFFKLTEKIISTQDWEKTVKNLIKNKLKLKEKMIKIIAENSTNGQLKLVIYVNKKFYFDYCEKHNIKPYIENVDFSDLDQYASYLIKQKKWQKH